MDDFLDVLRRRIANWFGGEDGFRRAILWGPLAVVLAAFTFFRSNSPADYVRYGIIGLIGAWIYFLTKKRGGNDERSKREDS